MSFHKFKGDMKNISERQLEFISEVLNKYGYCEQQVIVSNMGNTGDNYGSYVKRFTVESKNGDTFKMIGKIAPEIQILALGEKAENDSFINEITAYDELLPKMSIVQENAGIPENDRLRRPLCYGALSEPRNEMILLEDLNARNFMMLDKRQPLNDRVIKIILQNLANYHSMSYVLKHKESKDYEQISQKLINIMTNTVALRHNATFYQETMNDMISMFTNNRYINVINEIKEHFLENAIDIQSADRGSKYNVILHGDLWTNNVMFQMQDEQPAECMMIDYQLIRESAPVVDLLNLILCCTDYETRSKHYHEWIDYYYLELDRYLNNFGLKAKSVYPRNLLDNDLKRYSKMCLGISLLMINFMMRQTQEAPDMTVFDANQGVKKMMDSFTVHNLKKNTIDKIKCRIEGLIDSCLEFGYITAMSANLN